MPIKLHQAVTIRKARKSTIDSAIVKVGAENRKPELFSGLIRRFEQAHQDEPAQPDERKGLQRTARAALEEYRQQYTELFDLEAQVEYANGHAKADVVVDGVKLLSDVPAVLLLHLEKKVAELGKLIDELPVLDSGEEWVNDPGLGAFRTEPTKKASTKKVQKALVLYPHSEHHPAQTQLISVDEIVGYWVTVKHSSALPAAEKSKLVTRCAKLLVAVKSARAEANLVDAPERPTGAPLLKYLLGE